MFRIEAGNTSETCTQDAMLATCERLSTLGPLTIFEDERCILRNGQAPATEPVYSTFGAGNQVVDDSAKARIEAQHATLISNGVKVDAKEQFFATGTRMAKEGYAYQATRKREHDAARPIREAGEALRAEVIGESREDRIVTAAEVGRAIAVNGKISAFGLHLTEQAIRGLATRLESPMLGYILGLRARIAAEHAKGDQADRVGMRDDKAKIADILAHECARAGDVKVKLRTRASVGDVFAVVSPTYAPADAPAVLAEVLDDLPRDAKGTYSYDPSTTAWELRADVWTPTPVEEQAVGEAFSGYVSFQSRDDGGSSFRGGGGVLLLRCLNASTYTAESSNVRRIHRGTIMTDIGAMVLGATRAISALCKAWGTNRQEEIAAPVPLEVAIPGFYRWLLRDRTSELAGVLPGRSEEHAKALTQAFWGERRDPSKVVRSDLAQGWTRYIQDQPTAVRREAESAVGSWLVNGGHVGCDLLK
jgi:hypothetical protein